MENLTINWELKRAIKEAGHTLDSFGKEVDINRSILSWATTGRINLTPEERRKIAVALGKPEDELFRNF